MYSLSIDLGVLWIASKNVFFKLERFWEFFFREKSGSASNYRCCWESSPLPKMFIALKTWIQCMYNCPQQVPLTFHTCLVLCVLSDRTSEIIPRGCLHQILLWRLKLPSVESISSLHALRNGHSENKIREGCFNIKHLSTFPMEWGRNLEKTAEANCGLQHTVCCQGTAVDVWYRDYMSLWLCWSVDVNQIKTTGSVKLMASILGGCNLCSKTCIYRFWDLEL